MNRLVRIILIVVLVCVVGIIAAYFVVRAYLTPARVQTIADRFASEAFHRPVTIGDVGVHFGFNIGIVVNNVSMPNTEGFSSTPLLQIDRATLVLAFLPLLRRQISIHGINLTGVKLNLERNRQGVLNFDIVVPKEQRGPGWRLALSSISLSHATIVYTDNKTKTKMQLEDVRQHISFKQDNIRISGRSTFHVESSDNLPVLDVYLLNSVAYDPVRKHLDIKQLFLEYEGARIEAAGMVTDLKNVDVTVKGDINNISALAAFIPPTSRPEKMGGSVYIDGTVRGTIDKLTYGGLCELKDVALVPKGMARGAERINGKLELEQNNARDIAVHGRISNAEVKVTGSVENISRPALNLTVAVQGDLSDFEGLAKGMEGVKLKGPLNITLGIKGKTTAPVYSGKYSIENATIEGIGLAKAITNFVLKGTFAQSGADIQQCTGAIGSTDFSFNGRITNFKKPVVQLTNRSNQLNLDEFLAGSVSADKGLPITLQGTMAIKKLTGMDMEFKNINTSFMYQDFVVDIKNCAAEAFDGSVLLNFHYDARNPEPYTLDAKLTSVSARPVFKRLLKIDNIEGRLSSNGNYEGRSFKQKDVKSNLNAQGTYIVTNGVFNNFTFTTRLLSWLGLKDYSKVDIREMAGYFEIRNGKAKVENWVLSSSYGNFLVNGTIGLSGDADLDIVTTLEKKYSDIMKRHHAEWLLPVDDQGRTMIDITATGTLQSPNFSLNKSKIQERLKGKITDDFKKKKQELQNKLKGLFGG